MVILGALIAWCAMVCVLPGASASFADVERVLLSPLMAAPPSAAGPVVNAEHARGADEDPRHDGGHSHERSGPHSDCAASSRPPEPQAPSVDLHETGLRGNEAAALPGGESRESAHQRWSKARRPVDRQSVLGVWRI